MEKKLIFLMFLVFFSNIFSSCSEYQKLLNSDDASEKYKQAEIYYNNGEYRQANRLFEQIIPKYRGRPQSQRIIFFSLKPIFKQRVIVSLHINMKILLKVIQRASASRKQHLKQQNATTFSPLHLVLTKKRPIMQ